MTPTRHLVALAATVASLSACYVVPVRGPDGVVVYESYPLPPSGASLPAPLPAPAPSPTSAVLSARLYPAN